LSERLSVTEEYYDDINNKLGQSIKSITCEWERSQIQICSCICKAHNFNAIYRHN